MDIENNINRVATKATSARFLMTIMFSITYCLLILKCSFSFISALQANPEKLEAFATGLLTGFSGVVVLIIKSYFDMERVPPSNGTQKLGTGDIK